MATQTDDLSKVLGENIPSLKARRPRQPPLKPATAKAASGEERVKIRLEENDAIPPSGLFLQHNGRPFLLRPGMPVAVPKCLLNILNDAVMSVAETDDRMTVKGYRNRLRYPYQIVA